MTYRITDHCIGCYRCASICPTGAISHHEHQYQIDPERCNDCAGAYAVPQCWAACPTDSGCVPILASLPRSVALNASYWDNWFEIYNQLISRLEANHQSDYWQRWFTSYSQALSHLYSPTSAGANA